MNPFLATLITFAVAIGFLRLMDFFAQRGWIESRMSRKLIHIGTGPVFVLCWLLYANRPEARPAGRAGPADDRRPVRPGGAGHPQG